MENAAKFDYKQMAAKAKGMATNSVKSVKYNVATFDYVEKAATAKDMATNGISSVKGNVAKIDYVETAAKAKGAATNGMNRIKEKVVTFNVKEAPQNVVAWVREHPGQAAVHGTSIILLAAPGIVTLPALGGVGFGAQGVVSG